MEKSLIAENLDIESEDLVLPIERVVSSFCDCCLLFKLCLTKLNQKCLNVDTLAVENPVVTKVIADVIT